MGMPFNEPEEDPRDPPPDESDDSSSTSTDNDEDSAADELELGQQELQPQEWYSSDDSDEWEDPSEDGVLTLVFRAAEHGDAAELRQLLDTLSVPVDTPGHDNDTALHLACLYGHVECARMLVAEGHAVDVKDEDGALPIHDAAAGGYADLVQLLLDAALQDDISIANVPDCDGDTPLHNAVRGGSLEVVAILLESGADATAVNAAMKTPGGLATRGTELHRILQEAEDAATRNVEGDEHQGEPVVVREET